MNAIFNNLDKVDKFLDKYQLLKLKLKEIENLNYSITINKTEFLKKKISCSQRNLQAHIVSRLNCINNEGRCIPILQTLSENKRRNTFQLELQLPCTRKNGYCPLAKIYINVELTQGSSLLSRIKCPPISAHLDCFPVTSNSCFLMFYSVCNCYQFNVSYSTISRTKTPICIYIYLNILRKTLCLTNI